MIIITIIDLV